MQPQPGSYENATRCATKQLQNVTDRCSPTSIHMCHRRRVAHGTMPAVLNDAMVSLLRIRYVLVSDRVESHKSAVNKQSKPPQICRGPQPRGIERPYIKPNLHSIADMEDVPCHSEDHRASAIMLQGILISAPASEYTSISVPIPSLKTPVRTSRSRW